MRAGWRRRSATLRKLRPTKGCHKNTPCAAASPLHRLGLAPTHQFPHNAACSTLTYSHNPLHASENRAQVPLRPSRASSTQVQLCARHCRVTGTPACPPRSSAPPTVRDVFPQGPAPLHGAVRRRVRLREVPLSEAFECEQAPPAGCSHRLPTGSTPAAGAGSGHGHVCRV